MKKNKCITTWYTLTKKKRIKYKSQWSINLYILSILKGVKEFKTIAMAQHRIYNMAFSSVYPYYVQKAERKNRTKQEVDTIICWLTGFNSNELYELIDQKTDFRTFFEKATLNPKAQEITGVVCGIRVEQIEEPLMQKIRYLDKLIDELARGKSMEKILRS